MTLFVWESAGSMREEAEMVQAVKHKVDVQWMRTQFALVHNIAKIYTFGSLH